MVVFAAAVAGYSMQSGRAVSDLKQEDFRVFDDGKLQRGTSFSLENVERLAVASGESGPPPTLDLGKLPSGVTPSRRCRTAG